MANYLVTGGAGFIGSNIVARLVEEKENVRVLDNFSTGKMANLKPLLNQIELIEGDLREAKKVKEAVKGIDYCLHQAALPSVARSIEDPFSCNEVNITGTLNLLLACRNEGIKRVVYASSSSVYGNTPILPKQEDMPTSPLSPYAVAKLTGEQYCKIFYSLYGLETVVLRYFNVFGPNQDPASEYAAVIPKFITSMLKGNKPTIFGDGEQSRDFSYIDNVVEANLLAAHTQKGLGQAYNIACGARYTLNDLVEAINQILDTKIEPIYAEPRPGDVRHSLADISKAKEYLGYEPQVSFVQGLKKTIEWYRL